MKGIILAGGRATRLRPLTKITSKQLLPVYNKPMIFYPIETLVRAGIKDILIIIAPEYAGHFLHLLGSGREFGAKFTYEIQDEPRGLADAFIIGENFIGKSSVALILGDNIFDHDFGTSVKAFKSGAKIFVKHVSDPQRYGVVEFDQSGTVVSIEEKPKEPKSNFAQTGMFVYDNDVIEIAKNLKASPRGEIEITDVNKEYLKRGELSCDVIEGVWEDAGTFDSLLRINNVMAERAMLQKSGSM